MVWTLLQFCILTSLSEKEKPFDGVRIFEKPLESWTTNHRFWEEVILWLMLHIPRSRSETVCHPKLGHDISNRGNMVVTNVECFLDEGWFLYSSLHRQRCSPTIKFEICESDECGGQGSRACQNRPWTLAKNILDRWKKYVCAHVIGVGERWEDDNQTWRGRDPVIEEYVTV